MRKWLLFIATVAGTVFLVAGVGAIARGDSSGWWLCAAAILVYVLGWAPGKRLRESAKAPPGA